MIVDYVILEDDVPENLALRVKNLLKSGWILYGELKISSRYFIQVLVKEEK